MTRNTRRRGVTLLEVLTAIFIMGVGLLAILTLFPLGALSMARAVRDDRAATIGANATIVCGNELGEYCLIAAGAVVTKPVAPYALMAGVPARRIGWVSRVGEILDASLTCKRTGERYREENGRLIPIE